MNAVVKFQEPRLPYHDAINERYGVDRSSWKALTEAVFPSAKTVDSVVMALAYCKARKLDPFKRPVHIVPMWSAAERKMVETVWPGVSEIRTTAFRTGQFAGMDAAIFGPMQEREFLGKDDNKERKTTVRYPEWCQITVHRVLNGRLCAFVGPVVYWLESYGRWKNTDVPNEMWAKRPHGQLEKCAEAASLRRAFPEEVGNDYAAEEMEGQRLLADQEPAPVRRAPAPPMFSAEAPHDRVAETVELVSDATPVSVQRRAPPPPEVRAINVEALSEPASFIDVRDRYTQMAATAKDEDELEVTWQELVEPHYDNFDREDQDSILAAHRRFVAQVTP